LNISPNLPSLSLRSRNNNSLKPIDVNRHYPKLELRCLLMAIRLPEPRYMEVFLISLSLLPLLPPLSHLKKVSPRRRGLLFRRSLSERTRLHRPISQKMMSRNLLQRSLLSSLGILHQLLLLSYRNCLPCRLSRCLRGIHLLKPKLRRRGLG